MPAFRLFLGSKAKAPPAADCPYEAAVLADSPVFLLPMDEASGNLTDLIKGKSAVKTGSPTYGATGPIRGHTAVQFTENTQWFLVDDHADLDIAGSDVTIELWYACDTDAGVWQGLLSKRNAWGVSLYPSYGQMAMVKPGVGSFFAGTEIAVGDGVWHHYALRRRATSTTAADYRLFIDGEEDTLSYTYFAIGPSDTSTGLHIGVDLDGSPPDYSALGKIAYVAIYKSWLSDERIAAHYAAARMIPRSQAVMVA